MAATAEQDEDDDDNMCFKLIINLDAVNVSFAFQSNTVKAIHPDRRLALKQRQCLKQPHAFFILLLNQSTICHRLAGFNSCGKQFISWVIRYISRFN